MTRSRWTLRLLLISMLAFCPKWSAAQDEPDQGDEAAQAPNQQTGVARVSLIHGDVSSQRGDSGDWVALTLNTPLVEGDRLSTGGRSRVEIELDHANILRMDENTEVILASLKPSAIQLQVAKGHLSYSVSKYNEADIEISTPNMAARPVREGVYRVRVDSDSQTQVVVRQGEIDVVTPQGKTRVEQGDLIAIRGSEEPEYQITRAPGRDEWDRWTDDRDRTINNAKSWNHANRYYTGSYDLDRYGQWKQVPGYDWVWSPSVDSDWVPYSSGRWVWQPYWGWTWVSYEPWGWAPYHYGRWFVHAGSWCWWPGATYARYRPLWAPAYVSFFGFGFGGRNWHFGFGFGYNRIGWMPVGPSDCYYPWYGRRNSYNVVNVTNITNVRNIYESNRAGAMGPLATRQPFASNLDYALHQRNGRAALTAVSTEDFVRGRMGQRSLMNAANLRQAQLVTGTIPAVPTNQSLHPSNRAVNPASLPSRNAASERFFATRQPAPVQRNFNTRAAEIQQMVQNRNPSNPGREGLAASQPGNSVRERIGQQGGRTQSLSSPSSNGMTGSGNPSRAGELSSRQSVQERMSERTNSPNWSRFGRSSQVEPSPSAQPGLNMGHSTSSAADRRGQVRETFSQRSQGIPVESQRGQVDASNTGRSSLPIGREQMQRDRSSVTRGNGRFVTSPANDRSSWERFTSRPGSGSQRSDVSSQQRMDSRTLSNRPSTTMDSSRSWDRYSRGAPSNSLPDSRSLSNRPSPTPSPMNSGNSPRSWDRYGQSTPSGQSERSWRGGSANMPPDRGSWNAPSRPQSVAPPMRDFSRGQSDRSQYQTYRESPRSYQRPPLELSKPIVTQRAPQTYRSEPPSHSSRSEVFSRQGGGGNGGGGGRAGGGSRGGGEGRGRR